jgi:shikimate kinase
MNAGRRVYIIGFMGSGKSTAGKKLASSLGWHYKDLDQEIELLAGIPIRDIFATSGEHYFRELEAGTLTSLKTTADTVISAGGGTPCYGRNMDFMLETGTVVYLKMSPSQLISRLERGKAKRPLIKDLSSEELLKYITEKLSEREIYYLKAHIVIDSFNLDIESLCQKINAFKKD